MDTKQLFGGLVKIEDLVKEVNWEKTEIDASGNIVIGEISNVTIVLSPPVETQGEYWAKVAAIQKAASQGIIEEMTERIAQELERQLAPFQDVLSGVSRAALGEVVASSLINSTIATIDDTVKKSAE